MKSFLPIWLFVLALVPIGAQAQNGLEAETVAPLPRSAKAPKNTAPTTKLQTAAACQATTTLNFNTRQDNENWENLAPFIIGGAPNNTTISTEGTYVEPSATETSLYVKPAANTPAADKFPKALFWYTNYVSQNDASTEITFNLNRPVNNFSLRIQDVDRNATNFIDAITFFGTQADGTILNLSNAADATVALNDPAYTTLSGNTITALQQTTDGEQTGTVTVTFNKPIVKFRIVYQNTFPIANPGVQYIVIDNMSFCTEANVATTLTGPDHAKVGSTVSYTLTTTASGDYGVTGLQERVQLIPNLLNVTGPAGFTYNSISGLLVLPARTTTLNAGASQTSTISYTMPAATVTGTASSTISTVDSDPTDNNGTLANAKVTTVVNTPPVATNKSTTTPRGSYTNLLALSATDANNDAVTYTINQASLTALNASGTLYVRNGASYITVNTANYPGLVLTPAQAAALSFFPNTTAAVGNVSFTYTATDTPGDVSNTATYTLRITNNAPAATPVTNSPAIPSSAGPTAIAALAGTDADGTIASYQISTLPTDGTLFYYNGYDYVPFTSGNIGSVALTPSQAASLRFDPSGAFRGNVTFTFNVTDNDGATGTTPATYTIPVSNVGPTAIAGVNSNVVAPNANTFYALDAPSLRGTDPDGTISSYRITGGLPTTAQGSLYYSLDNRNGVLISTTTVIPANSFLYLLTGSTTPGSFTLSLQFTATDNSGLVSSNTATYTVPVNTVLPFANDVTTASILSSAAATAISPLSATAGTGNTIFRYILTTIPNPATQGTLFVNGVAATAGQEITPTQAGQLTFDPIGTNNNTVTFTYSVRANNATGPTDPTPATYTIPVGNVAPTAANTVATMPSSAPSTAIPVPTAADADGPIVSYTLSNLPAFTLGTLYVGTTPVTTANFPGLVLSAAQAADLRFDPVGTSNGSYVFNFTATDNNGSVSTPVRTYTITVSNVAPVASNVTHTPNINSNSTAQTNLTNFAVSDADGTVDSYQIRSLPASGTLFYPANADGTGTITAITADNLQGGAQQLNLTKLQADLVRYTPSGTSNAPVTFTYGGTDNNGATSNAATYTILFNNALPVAQNVTSSPAVPRGSVQAALSPLVATDTDGTIASYQLSTLPTSGTLFYNSTGSTYEAVTAAMLQGGASPLNLTPAQAASLKFTPAAGSAVGNVTFTYTATDNDGGIDASPNTFTIPVSNVLPETADKSVTLSSSAAATSIPAFTGTDSDGTVTGFRVTGLPSTTTVGTLSIFDGVTRTPVTNNTVVTLDQASQLQFDPSGNSNGTFTFSMAAIDNNNGQDASPATYTLNLTNTAPVASNTAATMASSAGVTDLPTPIATDPDNGVTGVTNATYTLSNLPTAAGTLYVLSAGTNVEVNETNFPGLQLTYGQAQNLRFDPNGTVNGPVAFNFTVTDVQGAVSNEATFTITLTNVVPAAQPVVIAVADAIPSTNGPTAIPALAATDADGTIAAYQLVTLPANGTLYYPANTDGSGALVAVVAANVRGGAAEVSLTPAQAAALQYDPNGNYPTANNSTATDPFTYTAIDDDGGVDATPATYTVRVRENDTETVYSAPNTYAQLGLGNGSVVATATDADGDLTSATFSGGTTLPAFLTLNPTTGTITVNNNPVVPGTYNATINTVDVLGGESTNVPVSITITNAAPVAQNVTNTPDMLNTAASTAIAPLQATDADGTIVSFTLSNLPTAAQGVLYVGTTEVNTTNFPGLSLTPVQAANLFFDPAIGYVGTATFNFTATDNNGGVSNTATYGIPVEDPNTINGFVFEDVNYGGGNGRSLAAAGGITRPGAVVELYYTNGNPVLLNGTIRTTTTDASGAYTFGNLSSGNYLVRVVNSSVTSSRTGATAALIGVQTFVNGDGTKVGGTTPASVDGAANNGSQTLAQVGVAQSLANVTVANAMVLNSVDFGFNFDVVVNTNNAGQGSLRQFVINSNALQNNNNDADPTNDLNQEGQAAGIETAIFRIPAAQLSGPAFVINLTSGLPNIAARTTISGSVQTAYTGDTNVASATSTGPEIILNVTTGNYDVLGINGGDVTLEGMGITGARATAANLATDGNTNGTGVYVSLNGDRAVITNMTIYNNLKAGILVNRATGVSITGNIMRDNGGTVNGISNTNAQGIALLGADQASVSGNTISGNSGSGVLMAKDFGNTINPASNTLSTNLIINNGGDGIRAISGTQNIFSQNTFSANAEQAIDLMIQDATTLAVSGEGVTTNDDQDGDTGANTLINFPVFEQATINNNMLYVQGYATPGARVELYLAEAGTGENFGEGKMYIASFVEGSADDLLGLTGSYSGTMNGLTQGSENNQNMFRFALDMNTLPQDIRNAIAANGALFTATATLTNLGTSEFTGNMGIATGPLPVELVAFTARAIGQDAQLNWATATEKNNAYFEVERSFDGSRFTAIGRVAGHGSTASAQQYAYLDKGIGRAHTGLVYYRLRQVDLDGTLHLSEVRTLRFSAAALAQVTLFPNPATSTTTLELGSLPTGTYQVTVVDAAGRVVRNVSVQGGQAAQLDVRSLAEGAYMVLVRGAQTSQNLKLVKHN